MKNKLPTIVLIAGLAVIAVASYFYFQLASRPKAGKPPAPVSAPVRGAAPAEDRAEAKLETIMRKSLAEGWGRNPFFRSDEKPLAPPRQVRPLPPLPAEPLRVPVPPPAPRVEKDVPLKLEMILMMGEQKIAILSGQQVKEGDKIGEELVTRIEADGVVLQRGNKSRTIKLDQFLFPIGVEKRRS